MQILEVLIEYGLSSLDRTFSYFYNGVEYNSAYVGKAGVNNAWYLKAQELLNPACGGSDSSNTAYEKKTDGTSDENYISTSDMMNTTTPDGFILENNEHLISYYNNFKKYFQFVVNYDIYNNDNCSYSIKWIFAFIKHTSRIFYC